MRELRQNEARRANDPPGVGRRRNSAFSGFSLVELLIVLTLILVLVTLYWSESSPSRQRRQKVACQEHLEKVFVALQICANDNGGRFPVKTGAQSAEEALDALVPQYTVDTSLFICPGSHDSALPAGSSISGRRISYAYYMGRGPGHPQEAVVSDRQINTRSKNTGELIFSTTGKPPGANHNKYGGNVMFCDGRVESSPPSAPFPLVFAPPVVLLNPKP